MSDPLTTHPNFRWMPGLLTRGGVRVTEEDVAAPAAWMERRSLDYGDAATGGCLLAMLATLGGVTVSYPGAADPVPVWAVHLWGSAPLPLHTGRGPTLGEACRDGLLAAWGAP